MGLTMPVVFADRHDGHDPGGEVWIGVRTPATEVPERAERIRRALVGAGATVVPARPQPDAAVLAVHDRALLAYLASAWDDWVAAGYREIQDRVVPYLFPHPDLLDGLAPATPASPAARAGRHCYDTMTLIGPGTYAAARAAIDAAVTAADLVLAGAPAAYACCRPPGHHATRRGFGGSCYLNNAASAAARLRDVLGGPVAVLDLDAHHGNGTQSIFYAEATVLTGSVHVDPGAGWFPHYLGFASETGGGANRNLPLAPGSGDAEWTAAVADLARWAQANGARGIVVALGVDAAEADPESPLRVSEHGYRTAGRTLGALGLPTVVVQEGGYDLQAIARLVHATLAGIEDGRR